ncbi:hypothetical protein BLS_006033 [Venturia inaequalis]|uniref:Uncharacterized protein n=1 Tax=Venturia inaequalis TaxID=5025 RepID=A0A8H3V6J5_VENIN|nr:hypothetical protein BLS_006033 [Venturia inaequalis]KAE9982996.1 hypothetical protein EG328_010381 [Venturia inaequalis]KAE9991537.1 hypothetical protein EG327_011501 [Venturia inaequalis]RDI87825.1 hypothetical protein Vi05172_g2453 [Venturia inaequalis]
MRRFKPTSLRRAQLLPQHQRPCLIHLDRAHAHQQQRNLANLHDKDSRYPEVWFSGTSPTCQVPTEGPGSGLDHPPPDERKLKLGKTIRILHERLPTLLASPLPQEILSPQITLRLFPSTHPHLPTVTGRIAYTAALWTSPVAWGRVPVVGNIRLIITSERMVKNGASLSSGDERLIVRWKTCGKTKASRGVGAQVDKITEWLGSKDDDSDNEFCGLFLFEFDAKGRILTHTIEHVEEGDNWNSAPKVISVTDWLLGKAWRKKEPEPGLALGYCEVEEDLQQCQNEGMRGKDGTI